MARAGYRTLVTVLTKRMAEDLTEYLHENGVRVRYMHSDIDTHRAHRDHPRPAARRLRRAGRHQPPARGARHPGMRARRHPRRRQGGLPALGDLARADHRPRRPQRRRPGHPLRRPDHRLDGARHRRDRPAPRKAGRLQRRARHHAGIDQARHRRHPRLASTSATTSASTPASPKPTSPSATTSRP